MEELGQFRDIVLRTVNWHFLYKTAVLAIRVPLGSHRLLKAKP